MIALRVILDDFLEPRPSEAADYAEQLTAALIRFAPSGCTVDGFVPASTEHEYERIAGILPGLHALHKSALARRELAAAWQHGFTRLPGQGMVHAPSLLAPLARHDRINDGEQVVVTLHDTIAWTHPELLKPREAGKQLALAKRAVRYADAVVVPSHAVAESADELLGLGDRIRVIASATSPAATLPHDAEERRDRLGLPSGYVLAIETPATAQGIAALRDEAHRLSTELAVIQPPAAPADLAAAIAGAAVMVYPAIEAGFGMTVLDALALGTPVVHSDAPALVELTAEAGSVVEREGEGYGVRLTEAVERLLRDAAFAERQVVIGLDRARAFSWRSAAEKVWQLHADL